MLCFEIFKFEIFRKFKKISTYMFFLFFLLIGYFAIYLTIAGGGPIKRLLLAGTGDLYANAPFVLHYLINKMSQLGLLISSAYFINAAYEDQQQKTSHLYYSYPFSKMDFFFGRFAAAFFCSLIVLSATGLGAFLASVTTEIPDKVAQLNILSYVQPYLTGVIPTLIFTGALLFSLVLLTGKIFSAYTVMLVLLALSFTGTGFLGVSKLHNLAAIVDPFGQIASSQIYNLWTTAEKNINLIPFSGTLLFNRLLWLTVGILILGYCYKKFNFQIHALKENKTIAANTKPESDSTYSKITTDFSFKSNLLMFKSCFKQELLHLVFNRYFAIILSIAFIVLFIVGGNNIGMIRGEVSYPVTHDVIELSSNLFYIFFLIFSIFSAGELIWRDLEQNTDCLIDQLPVNNFVLYGSKLTVLISIHVFLATMLVIWGMVFQTSQDYFNYEISLYLKELFGINLVFFVLLSNLLLAQLLF